jgi:4-amino-4-deoxy-L-arabinose transferase-like glycosyltransferase
MINWQTKQKNLVESFSILEQKTLFFRLGMILIFLMAAAVRLYHISEPGVLIDREYTSAVFARSFYYNQTDSVADWQREIAAIIKQNQPILEPPVTEYLVSLIYRAIGSEQLWVSHILTALFWLISGIFFYEMAKMVVSLKAAVIATVYYLFTPLSILVSRSFQPDALMMMLFLMSLYLILRYYEQPTMSRLLLAGGVTGLGLLERPLILFALMGAYTALAIYRSRSWKFIFEKDFIIFGAICLLPSVLYYGYGIFIAGFLRWKVASSFRPHLYLHREYWEGWAQLAAAGVGYPILLGALFGLPTLRLGKPRFLLIGLWLGYIVFGLVFTMHIHTHGYYQAQLIPIVALSFSSLVAALLDYLRQLNDKWYWWLPVGATVLLIMFFDISEVQAKVGSQVFESERVAHEIGEIVNHSSHTVFVARYYGMPLQYYGELAGMPWPKAIEYWLYREPNERALSIEERLSGLGFEPEYFVITDFDSFNNRHADLKAFLQENCLLLVQNEHFLIYDGHCSN